MTAAYRPVRELIQQERLKDMVSVRESVAIFVSFYLLCIQVRYFISLSISFALKEKKKSAAEAQNAAAGDAAGDGKEERVITLRALNMEDFKQAKNQVNMKHLLVVLPHLFTPKPTASRGYCPLWSFPRGF